MIHNLWNIQQIKWGIRMSKIAPIDYTKKQGVHLVWPWLNLLRARKEKRYHWLTNKPIKRQTQQPITTVCNQSYGQRIIANDCRVNQLKMDAPIGW